MIIPVRCFTCGKVIADKWPAYERMKKDGVAETEIFERLGLRRYCCRRMLMCHVNIIDDMLEYA
jgi:DNA-directed RNA polymerase I, II, and III subunit RPABC5